ncbi:MAG TPA: FtsX-like permease family protein [Flexivirga sp.]|uniref:FtsX-like permease family protein n=1 Tax=Flexivirga sp. TaxID=1962927 RepID=UPI002B5B5524|nr:FtsX-like permease family protein [Flexivirga sp.]HWC20832.1 FtsX-like permease family protein [Flexivirga sp.]
MVLLIGLPLFLVAATGTFAFTKDVNATEGIDRTMGSSQALISSAGDASNEGITQSADGRGWGGGPGARSALRFPGTPKRPDTQDVQHMTGGSVLPVSERSRRVQIGDRRVRADVLGIDGRKRPYAGMATLTSGHWPSDAHEVLVSRSGEAHGIPTDGVLTVVDGDGHRTRLTVVGRVETPNAQDLVALPAARTSTWLLERSDPVAWPEVKHLNRYGLAVASREVINHPVQAEADSATRGMDYSPVPPAVWVLLGVGLVIVIALLAGPAFAASGSRHRRALAQLASNGATKRQLRKYVLAQALLLGALAALIAIVLGAVLGAIAAKLYGHWSVTAQAPGPVDLRLGWGLLLFGVAVAASLIAAFVPAVVASRVNLIAVLRGHVSAPKVRVGWPILGLVIAVVGGAVLTATLVGSGIHAQRLSPELMGGTITGTIALFAGTLMTAPWLLTRLGLLARHLPLPFRVAARDVSRQRGRAVATVGAILATVAALTTLSIAFASSDRASSAAYQPSLPVGQGLVTDGVGGLGGVASSVATVRKALPDAELVQLRSVGRPMGDPVETTQRFAAYTAGCTDVAALRAAPRPGGSAACNPVFGTEGPPILAASPEQLGAAYRLSAADVAALRSGHVLVPSGALGSRHSATVRLVIGTKHGTQVRNVHGVTLPVRVSKQRELTMVSQKPETYSTFGNSLTPAALVSTKAAAQIPGGGFTAGLWIRNSGGIPASAQQQIDEHLTGDSYLYVERGYDSVGAWLYWLIGGVFGLLVLVATLTATALSNAESRADSATFASLGAPASLRRKIAAANAAVVGLFGALLGLLVGAVAGIAVSNPVTVVTDPGAHHTITAIPWLQLLVVAIGVPLLAAALAALATRGRVSMTRRVT